MFVSAAIILEHGEGPEIVSVPNAENTVCTNTKWFQLHLIHSMATTPVPDKQLKELPPSAKLVFFVLKHHESLTQQQISDESLLPPRTVRYALSELQDEGLITNQISLRDARQQVYSLSDTGEALTNSSSC